MRTIINKGGLQIDHSKINIWLLQKEKITSLKDTTRTDIVQETMIDIIKGIILINNTILIITIRDQGQD